MMYVTADGDYGDGDFLYVFEDKDWTEEEYIKFIQSDPAERWDVAYEINQSKLSKR